ncbi:YigZ family protein [Verticiella sediminum]|uniref:YigZ family protein n=1 Tax=Verticiella sediminum TaxID=1247510 RepID=A0A556AJC1_9BURK|nr:YigZ family protein [Verticiella sediminum]TSH93004.1 YigZ family protein [Verticiella sediminum]
MSAVLTLATLAEYREEIRKSRFAAFAAPVDTPEAALAFLAEVADPAATHNCWAYRIGRQYRFQDDGEPTGTAGKPILQAIEGAQCDRVMLVVTRWFGGVKLGTGGLVRAYGGCAAACLRNASLVPWVPMREGELDCGFAELPLLRARLAELDARLQDERYGAEGVSVRLAVPEDRAQAAASLVVDLTRGRSAVVWTDG